MMSWMTDNLHSQQDNVVCKERRATLPVIGKLTANWRTKPPMGHILGAVFPWRCETEPDLETFF